MAKSSSNSKKRAASASAATTTTTRPTKASRTSKSKSTAAAAAAASSSTSTSTTRRSARASASRSSSRRTVAAAADQADPEEEQDELEQDELASSTGGADERDLDNDDAATTTTATALDNDLDSTLTGYGLDPEPASDTEGMFMHSANNRIIDLYTAPKPFKNPMFKKSKLRGYKTAKQLLTAQATAAAERDLVERMGLSPDEAKRVAKAGDPAFAPLWNKVRAPPFTRPQRKYCDLTGLPTNYTDPVSGLHYYDSSVYQQIKAMSSAAVQKCLAMRNKAVVI